MKKASSAILRSLSLRLSASPAAITPLPIRSPFDQQVTAELDSLLLPLLSDHHHHHTITSTSWLCHALDVSINTQKVALESLSLNVLYDPKAILDQYLDDNAKTLDSCNQLSEQIEIIQEYAQKLRLVCHILEGKFEPNPITLVRATQALDNACNQVIHLGLSKLLVSPSPRLAHGHGDYNLAEVLNGSKDVALMACEILGMALSCKSKSKIKLTLVEARPSSYWSCCLHELQKQVNTQLVGCSMLSMLQETVVLARNLREQIKCEKEMHKLGLAAQLLNRSCGKLEDGIRGLEERVKKLYKHLISVRMAVLGLLS